VSDAGVIISLAGMLTTIIGTIAISWAVVRVIQIKAQAKMSPPETVRAVADLEERVDQLQQQLIEAHERIDFTERLLTRGRDSHEGDA
jgi:hypothetical protein